MQADVDRAAHRDVAGAPDQPSFVGRQGVPALQGLQGAHEAELAASRFEPLPSTAKIHERGLVQARLCHGELSPGRVQPGSGVLGPQASSQSIQALAAGVHPDPQRTLQATAGVVEALGGEAYPHMDFYLDPVLGALTNVIIVRDLDPGTKYQVQLQRVEDDGSRSGTEILDLSTQELPADRLVIFDEAETPGYSIPSDFILATRFPFRGDQHYEFQDPACADRCFENLRRQNLQMVLPEMSEADAERAYFEFSVALEQATPSYYSQARLWWNNSEGRSEKDLAVFERFTIPALGRYVTYQIPLRAMQQEEGVFTGLGAIQAGLFEFTVGGDWDATALVSIDEVSIRW